MAAGEETGLATSDIQTDSWSGTKSLLAYLNLSLACLALAQASLQILQNDGFPSKAAKMMWV
jgi:hypothetical protein